MWWSITSGFVVAIVIYLRYLSSRVGSVTASARVIAAAVDAAKHPLMLRRVSVLPSAALPIAMQPVRSHLAVAEATQHPASETPTVVLRAPLSLNNLRTAALPAAPVVAVQARTIPPAARPRRALIFTMDSISDYVSRSKAGGPAGEIIVRESLEWGLREMGITPVVADSDASFARLAADAASFDLIFLDPWTFVDPGWRPRAFLPGREATSFCLSFFGTQGGPGYGWAIDASHVLTPYPINDANSFLGFVMEPRWLPRAADGAAAAASTEALEEAPRGVYGLVPQPLPAKKRQGVIWGKKASYLEGRGDLIRAIAAEVELHTTATGLESVPGVVSHGHLTVSEWHNLLAESRFMIGLGELCLRAAPCSSRVLVGHK